MIEISHPIKSAVSKPHRKWEKASFILAGALLIISAYDILPKSTEYYTSVKHFYFGITLLAAFINLFLAYFFDKIKKDHLKDFFFRILAVLNGVLLIIQGVQYIGKVW